MESRGGSSVCPGSLGESSESSAAAAVEGSLSVDMEPMFCCSAPAETSTTWFHPAAVRRQDATQNQCRACVSYDVCQHKSPQAILNCQTDSHASARAAIGSSSDVHKMKHYVACLRLIIFGLPLSATPRLQCSSRERRFGDWDG